MGDFFSANISEADPVVSAAIDDEVRRQADGLELIASENFVSEAVLQTMGTVFTNKYAEGYPGKRYYGGCEFGDVVENLAIDRVKQIFGCEHANVQPHSGAQANMAVLLTALDHTDTGIMIPRHPHPIGSQPDAIASDHGFVRSQIRAPCKSGRQIFRRVHAGKQRHQVHWRLNASRQQ